MTLSQVILIVNVFLDYSKGACIMDTKERLKNIIKTQLVNLGLRQKDLADAIGVPVSTLSGWLRFDRDIPAQYIPGIAKCLDRPILYLLTGELSDDQESAVPSQLPQTLLETNTGISEEALEVARLWDALDRPGKAIILGDIYRRTEGRTRTQHDNHDEQ